MRRILAAIAALTVILSLVGDTQACHRGCRGHHRHGCGGGCGGYVSSGCCR